MPTCNTYFLSSVVDNFMIDRMISKKKYMAAYMVMAKKEWQKLFQNTLWSVQSKWMTLQRGTPYNFVYVPSGVSRLLSVSVEDKCHLIQPLFYNSQLNIIAKPAVKKCGCTSDCGCSGVCESANSMTYTTKLIFTYNNLDYYEKIWQEVCPNGDILEYKETPTKQYNNTTGDGADYNADYNDDYLTEPAPFTDLTIVTVKSQKKICKLEVMPCGCPVENSNNAQLLNDFCGCNMNWGCYGKRRHCNQFLENVNNNYYGEVKLSECSTKIYFKPSPNWRNHTETEFPEFLLVNFQSNGLLETDEVLVPDYALDALEAGIYWRSVRFNTSVPKITKDDAYQQYQMEISNLTMFLNPISLEVLSSIQDEKIKW